MMLIMKNKLKHYTKAAKLGNIGIWMYNINQNTIEWDNVCKEILEVPNDHDTSRTNPYTFFTQGSNRHRIKKLIKGAITKGTSFSEKLQITTFKKNIKTIKCVCWAEYENKTPVKLLGTFQDVSREQHLIEDLKLSAKKFYSIFSSVNDSIFIIDTANELISDCNMRALELTEYNKAELTGLHYSKLFPDEVKENIKNSFEKHLEHNKYGLKETTITTKYGKSIAVTIASGKTFQVQGITYLVCFLRDITERKNNEAEMKLLSMSVEKTRETIVIANPQGLAVWANKAYLDLTGLNLNEVIGHKPGYLSKGPETDLESTNIMRKAIQEKRNLKIVILNYNKQKEKYWFELNITTVFDDQNNLINYVGIGRDVTARVKKEIELKQLLKITRQQNDKLQNFTHIISHNIRSHTSNLALMIDLIENTDNVLEKISYIDLLKNATIELSDVIENLNEIITIQNSTTNDKKNIALKREIEKINTVVNGTLKRSNIKIINNIPDDLFVKSVPAYLDSILLNLFTNAIKYRSHEREPTLVINCKTEPPYVVIQFIDNGLGLDLKKHGHKIFGMFKTFHGNEDARGIGLFITKNQIEAMNGKIEIESKEGFGTTFKLYFCEE